MDSILLKFKNKFIEETISLLDRLEKDLLELEKNSENKEIIESAFRGMHTIKGVSGMYGFEHISNYTHHMESIYQNIRERKLSFTKEIFDISFTSIDHIRKLLSDEKLEDPVLHESHTFLLENIKHISESEIEPKSTSDSVQEVKTQKKKPDIWQIVFSTNEQMFFRGISLVNIFSELATVGEFRISQFDIRSNEKVDSWTIYLETNATENEIREVFIFVEDECTFTKLSEADEEEAISNDGKKESIIEFADKLFKQTQDHLTASKSNSVYPKSQTEQKQANRISVDSSKLDQLMYLVSELITVNSQLEISTKSIQFDSIRQHLEKIDNLSKQFRNNALDIRLVPLSDTVIKFQRLIRDLSKSLNKKIDFQTHGVDTELDKNTIDRLTDPLMHIIRNCIDHGIETADKRALSGKPETGIIKLSAYQSGNNVFVKVEDDGNGIDHEKIRLKAVDMNLLKPTDKPTKQEIFDFIFVPGFSTAKSLTSVSGRGVGMDIVKKSITDLRGEIFVDSVSGSGTSFIFKLQQSLAIIDSLLLSIGSTYFIVPLSDIEICEQADIKTLAKRRNTATIAHNEELISFIDLRYLLRIEGSYGEKTKIIIVKNNNSRIGLLADRIVGEHQAVLKPLGKSFAGQKYISSASQLGDGNIAFMLDTNALFKSISITKNNIKL
jgi:two-component system, chemotaxis family, sensor kinase CheA